MHQELSRARGQQLAGLSSTELADLETSAKEALRRVQKAAAASESTCAICWDEPREVVFLPCMHRVCCSDCAKQPSVCPLCKAHIDERRRVYG